MCTSLTYAETPDVNGGESKFNATGETYWKVSAPEDEGVVSAPRAANSEKIKKE